MSVIVRFVIAVALIVSATNAVGTRAVGQQPRSAAATGTGIVSGVVVSSVDAQPVRRAIVKLSGRGEISRSAVTDDAGKFAIGFLPGGTYTMTVSKPAWITATLGGPATGGTGTPLVLRDAETIANLRIPLVKGGAISGTVRDHTGGPAEAVQVFAARADLAKGTQIANLSSSVEVVTTDDMGAYRIFGLAPGNYIVGALSKITTIAGVDVPTRDQVEAELRALQQRGPGTPAPAAAAAPPPPAPKFGYAPMYHPSAASAAQATVVTVGAGDDKGGTDILLMLVPLSAIDVQVVGVDGQPAPDVVTNISTTGPPLPSSFGLLPTTPLLDREARFRIPNVAPGTWTITARSSARVVTRNPDGSLQSTRGNENEIPPGTFYWAASTIDATTGVTSVTLHLRPGLTMTGRVALAGTAAAPPAPTAAQVRLSMALDSDPARAPTALFPASPPAVTNPKPDGSFEMRGLTPGPWTLTALVPGGSGPTGWWLRSAMLNGKDLLDAPIDVGDRDLAGVEITLSNRHTALSGTLMGADSRPLSNLVIVAMPEDRALWAAARRVRQTRPSTDGKFSFADLPPGAYLLAAVTDVSDAELRTAEFLASIAAAGIKVSIAEGEKKTQDLRVGGR